MEYVWENVPGSCVNDLCNGNTCPNGKTTEEDANNLFLSPELAPELCNHELRRKIGRLNEENDALREELGRIEDVRADLRQQRDFLRQELERCVEKCHQLERENVERGDALDDVINREQLCTTSLQKSMRECERLRTRLEAAEVEIQVIAPLNAKLDKSLKKQLDCDREVANLRRRLEEAQSGCEFLQADNARLRDANADLRHTHEIMINDLREKNRLLMDENTELHAWSLVEEHASMDRLCLSPIPDPNHQYSHCTSCNSETAQTQDSLCIELKAAGFMAKCSWDCSKTQELEEELVYYNNEIYTALEKLDSIMDNLAATWGRNHPPHLCLGKADATTSGNLEILKEKLTFLADMPVIGASSIVQSPVKKNAGDKRKMPKFSPGVQDTTARIPKATRRDSSTQICLQPLANEYEYGTQTFQELVVHNEQRANVVSFEIPRWHRETPYGIENCPISSSKDGLCPSTVVMASESDRAQLGKVANAPSVKGLEVTDEITVPGSMKPPRRKLSVCYRSFDVFAIEDRGHNKELVQVRRSLSSPSVKLEERIDEAPEEEGDSCWKPNDDFESNYAFGCNYRSAGGKSDSSSSPSKLEFNEDSKAGELDADEGEDEDEEMTRMMLKSVGIKSIVEPIEPALRPTEGWSSGRERDERHVISGKALPAVRRKFIGNSECIDGSSARHVSLDSVNVQLSKLALDSTKTNLAVGRIEAEAMAVRNSKRFLLRPPKLKLAGESKDENLELDVREAALPSISEYTKLNSTPGNPEHYRERQESASSTCENFVECTNHDNRSKCVTFDKSCRGNPRTNQRSECKRAGPQFALDPAAARRLAPRRRRRPLGQLPAVDAEMSSREDSSAGSAGSAGSDSEVDFTATGSCTDLPKLAEISAVDPASFPLMFSTPIQTVENAGQTNGRGCLPATFQRWPSIGRSLSESESEECNRARCHCKKYPRKEATVEGDESPKVFPSLTNALLEASGIANLPDIEMDRSEKLSETELERKYTAFSVGIATDRITLRRRVGLSILQRDQSERNLAHEVEKMQQDIQKVAPLCTDRDSIERVERVRHRLDMVARCAHRVSCSAETLGAVHQECRISRAVLVADRYLQVLRSRCEKLAGELAETKRILSDNNIVIEEAAGEVGEDLSKIRYRAGIHSNNRVMMARRRASIATISRPVIASQDLAKEGAKQRNSVSGQISLRRPSLTSESQKSPESDKPNRADSASIGELNDISERMESKRNSREENNNLTGIGTSISLDCNTLAREAKQKTDGGSAVLEELCSGRKISTSPPKSFSAAQGFLPWKSVLWCIIIFFFGFYVKHVISSVRTCNGYPYKWWSIDEILGRYFRVNNAPPRPI